MYRKRFKRFGIEASKTLRQINYFRSKLFSLPLSPLYYRIERVRKIEKREE